MHSSSRWNKPGAAIAVFCVLLALPGCTRFQYDENEFIDERAFQMNPPSSIAVAPFTNATGVPAANELAREDIYSHLARFNYQDIELNQVDSKISDLAVEHELEPDELPPPLLRESGLADAIMTGQVERVSKRWALFYSHIYVALNIEVIDTRTNRVIYSNEATGRNSRLVAPTSILGVLTGAWSALRHLRESEMEETLEEFSEKIMQDFPNPPQASEGDLVLRYPELWLPRNPMLPGDVLAVEFIGTPGSQAFADIGGIQSEVPVPEIERGHYRLRYRIPPGTTSNYAVVRLSLMNEAGQTVSVSLYQRPFSVEEREAPVAVPLPVP